MIEPVLRLTAQIVMKPDTNMMPPVTSLSPRVEDFQEQVLPVQREARRHHGQLDGCSRLVQSPGRRSGRD